MAIVILVGLAAIGSITILVIASGAIGGSQNTITDAQVQQAFQDLDVKIDSVARSGPGTVKDTRFPLPDRAGTAVRSSDAGRIWVNRTDPTGNTTVVINRSIGKIRYKNDDTETVFGYQNGAVFKNTGDGTRLLVPPEFSYTLNKTDGSPTLTVPIVDTVGDERLSAGDVKYRKIDTKTPLNNQTVVKGSIVTVTVKSEWYVGWADYFRDLVDKNGISGTAVVVNDSRNTATLRLVRPFSQPEVIAGIIGTTPGNNLADSQKVTIDSYNSTKGPYPDGENDAVKVISPGNVTIGNNVDVFGDVEVEGTLTVNNNAYIDGYANATVIVGGNPSNINGPTANNPDVKTYDPVDDVIDARKQLVSSPNADNNNSEATAIAGMSLSPDPATNTATYTLYSGNYYLDEIDLDNGDKLILRPNGGEINIVVNGTVELKQARVKVEGSSGRVNIWIDSEDPTKADLKVRSNSEVIVPGNDSTRLWWYMNKNASAAFPSGGGQTIFNGVIFGPGDPGTPGTAITIRQQVEYHGAIVGDVQKLRNQAKIHYDKALQSTTTIAPGSSAPRLTYLIATSYVVEIDDD